MSALRTAAGWGYRAKAIKPLAVGVIFIILGIVAWIYLNFATGISLAIIGIIGIIIGAIQWKIGSRVMNQ